LICQAEFLGGLKIGKTIFKKTSTPFITAAIKRILLNNKELLAIISLEDLYF
jgi:hypothetical protein